jgi:hypothetical protein
MDISMYKFKVLLIFLLLSGCSTTSNLNRLSDDSAKTARYYESIGQPQAAQREREASAKYKKESQEDKAFLADLLSWLISNN